MIETKRIYEPKNIMDGYRVLVDSYWPRGFTHSSANVDIWKKELAPSRELIRRFHSGRASYESFKAQYLEELKNNQAVNIFLSDIKKRLKEENVTLIYSASNKEQNQAVILADYLNSMLFQKNKAPRAA
ncbi:DUF488 family protein [Eubacterium sp. 1001713B170207_170306_E7]|uniref:DUF488 domain-containing protein n=1 Tax=Eubacterium sp. 1001713B170207_170306_E7 TaxID=2787097 RepID=UPI0018999882|nr:DUF488 family protein [Eubacterium sp. 1001713B170207_170306_E7]